MSLTLLYIKFDLLYLRKLIYTYLRFGIIKGKKMKKIFSQGLLAANIFVYSSVAFAGFGEKEWDFAPGESVKIGAPDKMHHGVEYSCKIFKPKTASFTLSYSSPSDLEKLKIVADNEKK